MNWLPQRLPEPLAPSWEQRLPGIGVGGLAVSERTVVVGSRDISDRQDLIQAYHTDTGELLWQYSYPAPGNLDYGNSPRATPLIDEPFVYTVGAFGHLSCLDLATGVCLWQVSYTGDFGAEVPIWGFAGSPLLVDGRLIVQPGGPFAAVVALDPLTGELVWKTTGRPAAYASLSVGMVGGSRQLVGLDQSGVVGWDAATGTERWRLTPEVEGDFGVPTPIVIEQGLLLTSENNGTRLHTLSGDEPSHTPVAAVPRPAPDAHTPVVVGDRVCVVDGRLFCLNPAEELRTDWTINDRAFRGYASIMATSERLLVLTKSGELILVDITAAQGRILDRVKFGGPQTDALSQPALVGTRLYARIGHSLMCLELGPPSE